VRESQAAVFIHEGQLADVFTPGLYMLETNNMPILTTLNHWDHGFKSPFKSEIYYVNTTRFSDLKWGTKNPIMLRDPEFGPTRLRAFGTYTVKVSDPAVFLREIVGTDGEFTMDEISYQIRNIIVQEFSRVIAQSGIPVLDMAANTADLGKLVASAISATMTQYGLTIPELYIENISLPPKVEEALDKRTSMGIAGDLGNFMQYSTSEAMTAAASNPNGRGGIAMATQMQQGPWGAMPTPPAPPVEHVWHIAVGGDVTGPFSKAAMGRKVIDGGLTRDSQVSTQGQDGWMRAEDVMELAQLFTVMPPPPPAG
jgi:membrane protease subunit (stomatin/prohibitin family)